MSVEKIFKTLHEGESNLKSSKGQNVTLLLGSNNSDKIILAYFLGDREKNLKSIEDTDVISDTSEYIIVDSATGKTPTDDKFYPELFQSGENNFYNCPVFDDYRDYDKNIASAYLTKKVIDESNSVNVLLVLNYNQIKQTRNFDEIFKLFNNFYLSLNDLDKYKGSIGLVINNCANGQYSKILDSIVRYLKNFMNNIDRFASSNQKSFFVKLIDILIENNGRNKIGIFKKPDESGDVSDKPFIVESKNWIKNLVGKLEFKPVDTTDFEYRLSDGTKQSINDLSVELNDKFSKAVIKICENIKNYYKNKKEFSSTFSELYDLYNKDYDIIKSTLKNLEIYTQPSSFITELMILLNRLKIDYSTSIFTEINRIKDYFIYFENLSRKTFKPDAIKWVEPIKKIWHDLRKNKNIYQFFENLYNFLTSYRVQHNKTIFNVRDVSKFGISHDRATEQDININQNNLRQFIQRIKNIKEIAQNSINPEDFHPRDIDYLNQILSKTLRKTINLSMIDTKMVINGDFIRLSQFTKLNHRGEVLFDFVEELEMMANHTVFIDDDIMKIGGEVKITIIAPRWEVIGKRKFNLNGFDGVHRMENAFHGEHGLPGMPGGPGGCIFGIAHEIVDVNNLQITANGGNGGNAQNAISQSRDGGKKGPGGPAGCIDIFITGENRKMYIEVVKGIDGQPGKGGPGGKDNHHEKWMENVKPKVVIENLPKTINLYKLKLRQNLVDSLKPKNILTFFNEMENEKLLNDMYDLLDYVDDFKKLETSRNNLKNIDLTQFYDSLIARLENYAKVLRSNDDYKKLLNFLYSAVLSTRSLIKNTPLDTLIVDMKEQFTLIIKRLEKFVETQDLESLITERKEENNNYSKNIQATIAESLKIINDILIPEIDVIKEELDEYIRLLKVEISELREEAEEEKRKLEEKKRQLKIAMGLGILAGIFKVLASVVSVFTGPVALIIGAGLQTVGGIVQNEADMLGKQEIPETVLPPGLSNALSDESNLDKLRLKPLFNSRDKRAAIGFKNNEKFYKSNETKIFDKLLEDRNFDYKIEISKFNNTKNFIDSVNSVKVIKRSTDLFKIKWYNADKHDDYKEAGGKIAETVTDLHKNIRENMSEIEKVNARIEQVEQTIKQLDAFGQYVDDKLQPILRQMVEDVRTVTDNLKQLKRTQLTVTSWDLQTKLRDIQAYLKPVLTGFKVTHKIQRAIEKLEELLNTIIKVYDQIQQYEEQKQLADHIHEITKPSYKNNPIQNQELLKIYKELEKTVKANEIFYHYQILSTNLRRQVFPFIEIYDGTYSDLFNIGESSLVDYVKKIKRKAQDLQLKYNNDKSTIRDKDAYIIQTHFNSELVSTVPFYTWPNSEYRDEIKKLFNGEKIFLKSDVRSSAHNSIKFKLIEINFKIPKQLKHNFNNILRHYKMSLTHLGNSYYKCQDKYYALPHTQLEIVYSFEQYRNEPVTSNAVYKKIKNGDISLSPYAMWSLQLEEPRSIRGFSKLQQFINHIDIELVGEGLYITENNVCSPNLNKFYPEINELTIDYNDESIEHYQRYNKKRSVNSTQEIPSKNSSDIFEDPIKIDSIPHDNIFNPNFFYSSSSSRLSSPINNIINWIKINIILQTFNSITQFFTHSNNYPDTKYMTSPHKFYNDVDNALVLAPVLLHLWYKHFKKSTKPRKSTPASSSRIQNWKNIIEHEQNLIDLLKNHVDNSEIIWYEDILENQKENIEQFSDQPEWDNTKVLDLEKSFITFNLDLSEDIKHHEHFKAIKNDKIVLGMIDTISGICETLPTHKKLIKHSNYYNNDCYINYNYIENTCNAFRLIDNSIMNTIDKTSLNLLE